MSTLADVSRVLNELRSERVVEDYAVGGAMAVLFYAEPARTYDLDVFVTLHGSAESLLDLSALYGCLKGRGFTPDAGHVLIHGVPVQFLPVYNRLVAVAVAEARELSYDDTPVRVVSPEYLVALALQAGGSRRRERAAQLLEAGAVDRVVLRGILDRHRLDPGGMLDE
ncbi:MAG: hypothetical protein A2V74_08745 [Acidobacteria bacterium RBG_16_70_10]|nr:MAG: hypothetical protein A2V74_08745 [Acidobacteria bacterium RBG_16_70_10]